jgi:hypothetical protein
VAFADRGYACGGWRENCCHGGDGTKGLTMTFLEAVFSYEPPVGERELTALNSVRDVYGIRLVRFNQERNAVTVEYDASRLTKSDIEFMLRNAGIRLQGPLREPPDARSEVKELERNRSSWPAYAAISRCSVRFFPPDFTRYMT